jgi:UDPglucose--hexose-1-phosphate uridylyltransferase
MSELRQDRTTGRFVIIAPKRRGRPTDVAVRRHEPESFAAYDPSCPFCPGHEAELPGILAETAASGSPNWSVRAVPNKFPAVTPANPAAKPAPKHDFGTVGGSHEVVIESPRHNADLATMTEDELQTVVAMYRRRCAARLAEPGIETVVLFRNRGADSGTSLMHPHAQIIALDLVPPRLAAMNEAGLDYFRRHSRCVACDEIESELRQRQRIVEENTHFAALVPYAAEHPFELLIVPKQHRASFASTDDGALHDFAGLLGRSLRRIDAALSRPSYNFVIDSAPKPMVSAPHFHWRLRIVPKMVTWGGFELGSGLPINPSLPENNAAALRAVI